MDTAVSMLICYQLICSCITELLQLSPYEPVQAVVINGKLSGSLVFSQVTAIDSCQLN